MATAAITKNFLHTFNAVEICGASTTLDISADSIDVTTSCSTDDDAREFMQGRYQWTVSNGGPADVTDAGGVETLFTNVTGGGYVTNAWKLDDGATTATNPDFNATASGQTGSFCTALSLTADTSAAATFSTSIQGSGALTRSES